MLEIYKHSTFRLFEFSKMVLLIRERLFCVLATLAQSGQQQLLREQMVLKKYQNSELGCCASSLAVTQGCKQQKERSGEHHLGSGHGYMHTNFLEGLEGKRSKIKKKT